MHRKLLIFFVACMSRLASAEPMLEKTDLFTAGQGGYAQYRIPGIVVTAKGTVLVCCEGRKTGKSDWDTIDIFLRRSTDGGRTWDEPRRIADVPGPISKSPVAPQKKPGSLDGNTYNNPVLIADRDGSIHLMFCLEYMRCFDVRSDDDGVTFGKPVEITAAFEKFRLEYGWKVIATGPGHGIQLKNGRLLVPVWMSTGAGRGGHRPSVTATIFSDDHGRTWQRGDIAVPNTDEWVNPNETVAAQLADGRVMLNVRTESAANRRLITTSLDGATHWSTPRFDEALVEPICMASMLRLGDHRILFANPNNLAREDGKELAGKPRDRKNLSIRLSEDDAATWLTTKSLEPGWSGYSDLVVLPDSTVLCFYERGSTDSKSSTKTGLLTVARFNLEWLTGR